MSKSKTLQFSADTNSVDLLYDNPDIMIVSLDLMHEDETELDCNRNKCSISHKAIEASLPTIFNKSISCRYNSIVKEFVTDITEHANDETQLFETHICGHIPSDARVTFVERENGKTYLNVEGVIDKYIEPQIAEIIKNNNNQLKVSVVFSAKGEQDEETGIFVIDSFVLKTITLLSSKVMEGIEGSSLKVLKFSKKQIETMNERYMQFAYNGERQDIFEQIKNIKSKKEDTLLSNIGIRELEGRLWDALKGYTYTDGSWTGKRYWIVNVLTDSKEVIVSDNQTGEYFKIPYKVSKDGDVSVKEEERKKVVEDKMYREVKNAFMFAKSDMGSGETIEIDKSEDAMSESPWGDVSKTALRNAVLDAKNYKELVPVVYLRVEDGWEDAPSEKLGYPVMEIKGGKAVYNRYGLASALAYAKAENDDAIVGKVMKLYKELDIDDDDEIGNKLDKDNPEIKKIKDDADAIEDNEKEEVKNASVDNPEEKKLADDVDADKDYWKKKHDEVKNACDDFESKYNALVEKCNELEKSLESYKLKEDREEMAKYLKSYKKSFTSDEYEIMASKIEKMSRDEFEKEVDNKIKEFVKKMSDIEEDDDDDDFKNSFGFMKNYFSPKTTNAESDLDKVLAQLNAK